MPPQPHPQPKPSPRQKYIVMNNMSYGNPGTPAPPVPHVQQGMNMSLPQSDAEAVNAPELTIKGDIGADWNAELSKWVNEHKYYPQAAEEQGQQGSVEIEFTVDRKGNVTGLHLLNGSGSPFLDQAWLGHVRAEPVAAVSAGHEIRSHHRGCDHALRTDPLICLASTRDARFKQGMMNDHAFGVQQSLTGRQWVWRTGLEERIGQGIAQALGVPELIGRLLAARGVSAAEAANFLDPTLRAMLPDPSSLIDMDAAAARLADAVVAGECVGVFGDYDVDGACSSALMVTVLRELGCKVLYHVPDRMLEGYGPNSTALRSMAERGAKLLVCVDCGTGAHEAFAPLHNLADVLVFDHHKAEGPPARIHATVNPNRLDCGSGLTSICATAVAFIACIALLRELRKRAFFARARRAGFAGVSGSGGARDDLRRDAAGRAEPGLCDPRIAGHGQAGAAGDCGTARRGEIERGADRDALRICAGAAD